MDYHIECKKESSSWLFSDKRYSFDLKNVTFGQAVSFTQKHVESAKGSCTCSIMINLHTETNNTERTDTDAVFKHVLNAIQH
jgi:hypothetical protein